MAFFGDARFPQELRDLVWEIAVDAEPSRIVELTGGHEDTLRTFEGDVLTMEYGFVSSAPIPATLHACSRSRELSKRRWTLTFDSTYKSFNGAPVCPENMHSLPRTWFDFKSDTLLFMEDASQHPSNITIFHFWNEIQLSVQERIQNVILNFEPDNDAGRPFDLRWEEGVGYRIKMGFPRLQNLSLSCRAELTDTQQYDLTNPETVVELTTRDEFEMAIFSMFKRGFKQERVENSVQIKIVWLLPK